MGRHLIHLLPLFLAASTFAIWSGKNFSSEAHTSLPNPQDYKSALGNFQAPTLEFLDLQILTEAVDRLVDEEIHHRTAYGYYTKILSRLGFILPRELAVTYGIRVVEASQDRLLITAFAERRGYTEDLFSIDQSYELISHQVLPAPRMEYLQDRVVHHLKEIRDAPNPTEVREKGVFKGYFAYKII